MPKAKWEFDGGGGFTKMFGPLKATAYRVWNATSAPTEYRCFLSCNRNDVGNTVFVVPIDADLGVEWFDDDIEKVVQKKFDKLIKSHIRGWLK